MEIEEWRPPLPNSSPPPVPQKDRTALIMTLVLMGVFFLTLAVLNRHELAGYARHLIARVTAPEPKQVSPTPPIPPKS